MLLMITAFSWWAAFLLARRPSGLPPLFSLTASSRRKYLGLWSHKSRRLSTWEHGTVIIPTAFRNLAKEISRITDPLWSTKTMDPTSSWRRFAMIATALSAVLLKSLGGKAKRMHA